MTGKEIGEIEKGQKDDDIQGSLRDVKHRSISSKDVHDDPPRDLQTFIWEI